MNVCQKAQKQMFIYSIWLEIWVQGPLIKELWTHKQASLVQFQVGLILSDTFILNLTKYNHFPFFSSYLNMEEKNQLSLLNEVTYNLEKSLLVVPAQILTGSDGEEQTQQNTDACQLVSRTQVMEALTHAFQC